MKLLNRTSLLHISRPPKNQNAPKYIILIHGYGADEHDLFSLGNYIPEEWGIISFRAPLNLAWGGYAWYHIDMSGDGLKQDIPSAQKSIKLLKEAIEEIKEELHPDKLILMGFSQGAILSWAIGLQNPEIIDGIAALSGFFIPDLLKKEGDFKKLDQLPLFMSHGTEDMVIDISLPRQTHQFFQANGLHVELNEYPQGHGIGPDNLNHLLAWLSTIE